MTLTFKDLKERLKRLDEVSLLEELEISAEDILDRFDDRIEEKFERLCSEFEDEDEEDS